MAASLIALTVGGTIGWRSWQQRQRNSSLIAAIKRDDADDVEAALRAGADPNSRDQSGASPELWQVLRNLVMGRLTTRAQGNPALRIAANPIIEDSHPGPIQVSSRDQRIRTLLLDAGADPNATDASGNTPLMLIANWWDTEEVELLLNHGANVNLKNRVGTTALMAAVRNEDSSVMKLLLDKGADPNVIAADRSTALSMAVMWDEGDKVEMLLAHHANPNVRAADGETVLASARRNGFLQTAQILVRAGATR